MLRLTLFAALCLCLCLVPSIVHAAATPKFPFDICKPAAADFDKCVSRAVESALKTLKKGYPPLGVFSVDPLHITAIDIDQGTGPISINLKFKELDIIGIANAKVHNFKSDLKNLVFTAKVFIPEVALKGLYSIDGKVLILPIKGEGNADLRLDDLTADLVLTGTHFKKDGKTYMKVNKFEFGIDTKKLSIKLENLFNGDKALGDNMNKFLNENWQDILKELKPAISDTFGAAFGEITNRIFTKVPFYDIFPPN